MTIDEVFTKDDLQFALSSLFASAFNEMNNRGEFGTREYWRLSDIADAIKEIVVYSNLSGISFSPRNIKKWRRENNSIADAMNAVREAQRVMREFTNGESHN